MRTAIGLMLLSAALFAAASSPSFTVAVVRRDGVIVPFANYDGKSWSTRWPDPVADPQIPINLSSVPSRWWGAAGPRVEWATWIDNRAGASIRVEQTDVVSAHCVRQVGLRTNYRSAIPPPPPDEQPYPKDGLAISPPQTIEAIESIDRRAPQLSGLNGILRDAFNRAENTTAQSFNHPVERKQREQSEPLIEAVYAFGQAPRTYYVEAVRTYELSNDRFSVSGGGFPFENSKTCGIAFGTGWFARDQSGFHAVDMAVRMVPCDRYGATYMLPFGAMPLGSHTYWIAQFSGWDHERYVVVDLQPKSVEAVINAWGGGC